MAGTKDPYRYFRIEARELLDQLEDGAEMLRLGAVDAALIQRLLRHAHTLKGAARVVRQVELADAAHRIEDALEPLRGEGGAADGEMLRALAVQLGVIRTGLQRLSALPSEGAPAESTEFASISSPPAAPAGQTAPQQPADEVLRTIRADVNDIDELLDGVAETHTRIGGLRAGIAALERAQTLADLLRAQLAPDQLAAAHLVAGTLDHARGLAADLVQCIDAVERDLTSSADQADRELRQLRDNVEQMRLLPARLLFAPLERTAAHAARLLDKEVRLETRDGDVRLDASMLEAMQRALVQLVRNALAHGIETRSERTAAGKPATGLVRILVERRGKDVLFVCTDDGRGIDIEALQRLARARGLPPPAPDAGGEQWLDILMSSGLSTAAEVTEVSGRGIGLDIVRDAVKELGGTIELRSKPAQGTSFHITVPLSLASVDVLQVESGGMILAVPIEEVTGALQLQSAQISRAPDGATMLHEGAMIPFISLSSLFGIAPDAKKSATPAIILRGSVGEAVVGVDRLLGSARAIIRPLPTFVACDAVVAGASLDAQGNPQLLLDADALIAAAREARRTPAPQRPKRLPILIIDDSLTTRMLEQSILESAGYEVDTATSAEEGLEAAAQRRYALFLVDVEMPGMDGFGFIERIRADRQLQDIPAILVSSRNSPDDLQRGTDVGAQGYMIKSEFNQKRLLKMIRELAG